MALSRGERFELFLQRLEEADAADSAESALALLRRVLKEVEDEHSGVPDNPVNWRFDGRLYPPMDDRVKKDPVRAGGLIAVSRGHISYLGANGAIRVYDVRRDLMALDRAGHDGGRLDE